MPKSLNALAFALTLPFLLNGALAQSPAPAKAPPADAAAAAPPEKKDDVKPSPYKKYEEVVTKDAVTQAGLFKVHRIEDRVIWEIPAKLIGRLLLWQTEVAELGQTTGAFPGSPAGTRTIRFTRRGTKLFVRDVQFSIRTSADGGIKTGVEANSIEPIIQSLDIQAEGDDKNPDGKSVLVDVTSLFTSDPQDFAAKSVVGGAGVDPSRSYIDRVKAFPTNIETRSSLTFIVGGQGSASASTATVHYSLNLLPETPMQGRLKDSRIGYFTQGFTEFGRPEGRSVDREFIDRFRLEKKDPNAAVSEPVKPIVFYLAREVPEKWRPYIKQAIEDWQPAFEKAGFKYAILAKDAPTKKEDPDWDPEDSRYSVIRWAPSNIENAMGPSIQDPRSGETISAHVIVWNDIERLLEDWYFSQCAAIDPKARQIPFSTELMGSLIRYVVVHEVGHTLGLEHNFKASAWYPVASLRDPKFSKDIGMSASIMDYSRFNYVAQPGDGDVAKIGKIGAYDFFAIEYGYKPIPGAKSPDEEKPALDSILGRQVGNPLLRFGNYRYFQDPTVQTEDIGSDPIEATTLGLQNLDRIGKNILLPTTSKFGEDYTHLSEKRDTLLNQRYTELFHVARLVGGVVETDYHAGRGGEVFKPTPAAQQRRAVKFLFSKGLATPAGLFEPAILNRVAPNGGFDEVTAIHSMLLSTLLGEGRIRRIIDNEALNGKNAYGVSELVTDVTDGSWPELTLAKVKVDIYHRSLQRAYLRTVDGRLNGPTATRSDLKLYLRSALRSLAKQIDRALPKSADRVTALHLTESRADIEKILSDKFSRPAGGGGFNLMDFFGLKLKDLAPGEEFRCLSPASRVPREILEELRNQTRN